MRKNTCHGLLSFGIVGVMVMGACVARGDDPPGGNTLADPFAAAPQQAAGDPFGTNPSVAAADPFAADPFGVPQSENAKDDPFGGKPAKHAGADPFAATAKKTADSFANSDAASAEDSPALRFWSGGNQAAIARIEKALDCETSLDFVEEPLNQVCRSLAKQHEIPILFDVRSLDAIGMSNDIPVTLSVHGVSLRSCLSLLLRDLDLTYEIEDEVLQITTPESAESRLKIAIYRLDNLGIAAADGQSLIQQMVVPDTWATEGGPSSIAAFSSEAKQQEMLVVSATLVVHDQTLSLLQSIQSQGLESLKQVPGR